MPHDKEIELAIKDVYTSKSEIKSNLTVDGLEKVLNTSGFGLINQILLISSSNDYNVYILIDDSILFDKSYTWFLNYSDVLDNISAYLKDGKYYLSIKARYFQKNVMISINTNQSITFDEIIVTYIIRDEVRLV